MSFLRDRLQRPIRDYFAGLEPVDRVTVIIVLALVVAIAVSFARIIPTWTPGS
jgi:hypothetical protein